MKIPAKLFLLAPLLALAACAVTVTTDYDHTAPFGKYRTYALEPAAHGQTLSPSSEAALRQALKTNLALHGITETFDRKADLAIVRQVFTQEKLSVQNYTDYGYTSSAWPYRYGSYGMWAGAPQTYTSVNQYTEGTMILDFVDAHTKKLVFRGTGQAIVGGPNSNAANISKAVEEIVQKLPIPAKN